MTIYELFPAACRLRPKLPAKNRIPEIHGAYTEDTLAPAVGQIGDALALNF